MKILFHRTWAIWLAATGMAVPALAAEIQVIYTKIPGHPTANIPGVLDLDGNPTSSDFRSIEGLRLSPDGSLWVLQGRTQLGSDLENILLMGSGTTGTMFAQEGQPIPGGAPGELFDFFGSGLGEFNTLNHFAYSARARGGVPAVFQKVLYWDGTNHGIVHQMGDLYTGMIDLAPNPSGDETVGNSIGSIHPLDNGTIGAQDSTILQIHTSRRPAITYGLQQFHQTGVTSVADLDNVQRIWNTIDANEFRTTPDFQHWMAEGQVVIGGVNTRVLVRDNAAVLQANREVAGSGLLLGDIFQTVLLSNGDWYSRGRDNSGTSSAAPDWAVRNGVLIAKTGDPIYDGAGETWGDTIYAVGGNRVGDYLVSGRVVGAPLESDDVIVLNGTTVLLREGDPVDVDGNGAFDDDAYIGRGNNTLVALVANTLYVTDDGWLYTLVNLRTGDGADHNSNPVFSTPTAFVRVRLPGAASVPGDMNCDGTVNNFDIDPFVLALTNLEEYTNQYPDCDPLNGDVNGDGVLNNFDIDPFVELLTGG